MSRAIATTILRTVSDWAASPYRTFSSLVTPSTSIAISSPKSRLSVIEGVRRVLDRVVQQRGGQGRRGHAQLGQDQGHGQWVGDVGVAALADLALVSLLGHVVRALEDADVRLGVGLLDDPQHGLQRGMRLVPGAAEAGQPGADPGGRGRRGRLGGADRGGRPGLGLRGRRDPWARGRRGLGRFPGPGRLAVALGALSSMPGIASVPGVPGRLDHRTGGAGRRRPGLADRLLRPPAARSAARSGAGGAASWAAPTGGGSAVGAPSRAREASAAVMQE